MCVYMLLDLITSKITIIYNCDVSKAGAIYRHTNNSTSMNPRYHKILVAEKQRTINKVYIVIITSLY